MMNSGMATLIHNYYRKREEKDPYVPVVSLGCNLHRVLSFFHQTLLQDGIWSPVHSRAV